MNQPLQMMLTVSLTVQAPLPPPLLVSMTNMPVQSQFSHNSGATSGATKERAAAASKGEGAEETRPPRTQKVMGGEGGTELRGRARKENWGEEGLRLGAGEETWAESLGNASWSCCQRS